MLTVKAPLYGMIRFYKKKESFLAEIMILRNTVAT